MKSQLLVVGFSLNIAASLLIADEKVSSIQQAEREVRNTEAERVKCLLNQDWATLERLYADDYLSFDSRSGTVRKKPDVLADLKSGKRKIVSVDDQEVVVRVYGTTAVITGLSRSVIMTNTREDRGPGRYIQVYVKREGKWQLVAHQYTLVAR